jgi:ArsR family transcriptional regulator
MKREAQIFKALGDETRLRIMALLIDGEELCVCDIMAALDIPQSTVSRHLSNLRNAGLVNDRRQGVWMNYRINSEEIEHATGLHNILAKMLTDLEQAVEDRHLLKQHLATKKLQSIC